MACSFPDDHGDEVDAKGTGRRGQSLRPSAPGRRGPARAARRGA